VTVRRSAHRWRAGVIAAGWGERLRAGTSVPKPLVAVGGQTLIERVLGSLAEVAPTDLVIIVNAASAHVKRHVESRPWPFAIHWLIESTPSSMHSFLRVLETLADAGDTGPYLMSTVDTIAPPGAFADFAAAASQLDADVALAVAPPSEDDKPLLVRVARDGSTVEAIGGAVRDDSSAGAALSHDQRGPMVPPCAARLVATAGYYAVRPTVLREAEAARRDELSALRLFLERLVDRGYRIAAVPVPGGIDVDRPADLEAAETMLRQITT
jgi:NDP-sugar pyrophosphorylase family protein